MGHMSRRCTDEPTHPPCVYNSKSQYTAQKPIHQQPMNPPCVYNSTTAEQQYSSTAEKKKQKSRDRGIWTSILGVSRKKKGKKNSRQGGVFELTSCLSINERSTAEPKGNVVIPCRLREGNFEKSSLAEFGCCTDIFA